FLDEDYKNRKNELLTFTLRRVGASGCENKSRAEWGYYFNDYMPVGSYSVTFTAKTLTVSSHTAWWNENENFNAGTGGTEYRGFTATYKFEVRAGTLSLQDEGFNQYGKEGAEPYSVDIADFRFGNYSSFFAPAAGKITFPNAIGRAEAIQSETYWSKCAEEYFDALPRLGFRLNVSYDGNYRASSADWSDLLSEPAVYTVYYRAEMKNYRSSPAAEEEYFHLFRVNLYRATAELSAALRDGDGNEIKVSVSGAPSGASLEVHAVSETAESFQEKLQMLKNAGLQNRASFELVFKQGETPVAPFGSVRVGISVPLALRDEKNLQIALVSGSGIHIVAYKEENGTFFFETDSLGAVCFVTPQKA
ncbi:MAG: hypothetical protein K2N74_00630, partial [Clostridiales bacterium]|nr:hypothetical protein [Clostridiales bacterium]